MNLQNARLLIILYVALLSGCSAFILSAGENEQDLVPPGASFFELQKTLGDPIGSEPVNPAIPIEDIRRNHPSARIFASGKWSIDASGKRHYLPAKDEAKEKSYYVYFGNVQGKHDIGEVVSANLMTLGIAELLFAPMAINERTSGKPYLFTVWFDLHRHALAYQIERLESSEVSEHGKP